MTAATLSEPRYHAPRLVESRLRELPPDMVAESLPKCDRPARVASVFAFLGDRPTEEFWVAALDSQHQPTALGRVSQGTLGATLVHPREVFGPAIRLGAAAIVVAHNHPSGDTSPSPEDWATTERLVEAGKLLGIPVLDHVIVGAGGSHRALRSEGRWPQ